RPSPCAERSRGEGASSRLGARVVLRRDQQQAFRFGPGAKGLAGGVGRFRRQSAFDPMQQFLRLAIEMIAGVAAGGFRRRLERTNRLVGVEGPGGRGVHSVPRPGAATGTPPESSQFATGMDLALKIPLFLEKSRRPMVPNSMELTGLFSKLPRLRTLWVWYKHDRRPLSGMTRCGAAENNERGGRLHGALGQKPTP